MMTAAALLRDTPKPNDKQIRQSLAGLKCRCGTHVAILRAVKRVVDMGGPDMAPHTPRRSERPGEAVALLDAPAHRGQP